MTRPPLVAVIGPDPASADEYEIAQEVGRRLAEKGAVVICGGRGGVMEAACRGAQTAGGLTVGLLPGVGAEEANPYVVLALATGLGEARNAVLMAATSAVIAVGGGHGTLSEIGFALKLGRPVVGVRTWTAQRADGVASVIQAAPDAARAVEAALGALGER